MKAGLRWLSFYVPFSISHFSSYNDKIHNRRNVRGRFALIDGFMWKFRWLLPIQAVM